MINLNDKPKLIKASESMALIKLALKEAFPFTEFTIECDLSRENCLPIGHWFDGPTMDQFLQIAGLFSKHPDEQSEVFRNLDGEYVLFENQTIMPHRKLSREFFQSIVDSEYLLGEFSSEINKHEKPLIQVDPETNSAIVPVEYYEMEVSIPDECSSMTNPAASSGVSTRTFTIGFRRKQRGIRPKEIKRIPGRSRDGSI